MGFPVLNTGDSVIQELYNDHVRVDFRCKHNGRVNKCIDCILNRRIMYETSHISINIQQSCMCVCVCVRARVCVCVYIAKGSNHKLYNLITVLPSWNSEKGKK